MNFMWAFDFTSRNEFLGCGLSSENWHRGGRSYSIVSSSARRDVLCLRGMASLLSSVPIWWTGIEARPSAILLHYAYPSEVGPEVCGSSNWRCAVTKPPRNNQSRCGD